MMKNALLAPLLVAWIAPAPPASKNTVEGFELGGSARVLSDDCIRLTPDARWVSGSAWAGDALDLAEPFDLQMSLAFGDRDALGADGIVFVLTPDRRTGWRGEGLGFAGLRTSVGIELDTYQNLRRGDPAADHMALVVNGYVSHRSDAGVVELPNLEDGRRHPLRVKWSPDADQLKVFLDGKLRATYPGAVLRQVFGPEASVSWGLTAGTGRKSNPQDVCFEG